MLKGAISYKGGMTTIAEQLGIHRVSLSRKLSKLSLNDLNEICYYLERHTNEFVVEYEITEREMKERLKQRQELKVKRKLV